MADLAKKYTPKSFTHLKGLKGISDGLLESHFKLYEGYVKKYNEIMERLDAQTKKRVVRSDWIAVAGAPQPSAASAPAKPKKNPAGFDQKGIWYDYEIGIN